MPEATDYAALIERAVKRIEEAAQGHESSAALNAGFQVSAEMINGDATRFDEKRKWHVQAAIDLRAAIEALTATPAPTAGDEAAAKAWQQVRFIAETVTELGSCCVTLDKHFANRPTPAPSTEGVEARAKEAAENWRIPGNADGTGELVRPREHCVWGYEQGFIAALSAAPTGERAMREAAGPVIYKTLLQFPVLSERITPFHAEKCADALAALSTKAPAEQGDEAWSFDIAAAPEGPELLVYRHDGAPLPWGYGVRAIATKEDGEWYGADGDPITVPACWTTLTDKPVPEGTEHARLPAAPEDVQASVPVGQEAANLAWFSEQHRLALHHYSPIYGDDDDQSVEWRVTRESGSINDREFDVVGRGDTAADAIAAALKALRSEQGASK